MTKDSTGPAVVLFEFMRLSRRTVAAALALAVLLAPAVGLADTVSELTLRLRESSDFRVRTQAALALGASGHPAAVRPLCQALRDRSPSVRTAAAAALGRLKKGTACMKARLKAERHKAVRAAISKALEGMREPQPTITSKTRLYLAIAPLATPEGLGIPEPKELARSGYQKAASQLESVALAPASESPEAASKLLGEHPELAGYQLEPTLAPPEYSAAGLKMKLTVAIFSYPDKSLIGSFNVRLTAPGAKSKDLAVEKTLMKMLAERAVHTFAQKM